jgi:hypothetical protein
VGKSVPAYGPPSPSVDIDLSHRCESDAISSQKTKLFNIAQFGIFIFLGFWRTIQDILWRKESL